MVFCFVAAIRPFRFHVPLLVLQELLGCLPPSLEPRATDYIPQMIAMIQRVRVH
jgi:hypothetical protein